ncbi:sorting nexin 2A-like [Raphidocelis subcapitata]|uniref:Sorting nexin 2A-like n=1 Tax=Raphidocelis subcapitata TaxID=307507 RepID=A0A2V0PFS1_9CHLO|nr:sorting nexin 2A-like [Raphidocelis subcapitata]|eukprot:GBF95905.1 sorting nexin 2A-like [Raphidocelis subcapitata]
MADPLTFGDEDGLVDLTSELERAAVDDPVLGGGPPAGAAPAPAARQAQALPRAADPLSDPLAALGPLGGPPPGVASGGGFDPFASGEAGSGGGGGAAGGAGAAHFDPFASYGALGPPPAYSDAAAAPAPPPAAAPPPQQQPPADPLTAAAAAAAGAAAAPAAPAAAPSQSPSPLPSGATPEPWDALPAPVAAAGACAAPPPLAVEIKEPLKEEQQGVLGMKGSYVSYLVVTRTTLPGWPSEVSVRRRFRDFVALADLIKARYRGYFVPPRPEKNAVEGQRSTDAFVEERREALQRYMARMAAHPTLGRSEELKLFLEAPGDLSANFQWQGLQPPASSVLEGTAKFGLQLIGRESRVVDPVAAAAPAARSKDLMRAMKEAATATGIRGASAGGDVPGDEAELRRAKDTAEEMRDCLITTSRAAERVVDKLDRLGTVCGDLGLALFKVAKAEEAQGGCLAGYTGTLRQSGALVNDEKRAAAALVRLGKMMARVTGRTVQELAPLHDYLGFMPAVLRGLTSREHALVTQHTLEGDLVARQKALADLQLAGAKVFGGDKAKAKKSEDLRTEVAQLELSIGSARAEYDRIKAINRDELERFAAERRAKYAAMVENFAATQVAAHERLLEVWLQLAGELGASPAELGAIRSAAPRTMGAATGSSGLLGSASLS